MAILFEKSSLSTSRTAAKRVLFGLAGRRKNATVFRLAPITRREKPQLRGRIYDPIAYSRPERLEDIRSAFDLSPKVFWYAILGHIGPRKSAPLVLDLLKRLSGDRPIGLLVAGRIADDVLAEIERERGGAEVAGLRVRIHNHVLSEPELDGLIACIDCLVTAHNDQGTSSAMLGKAAVAGTRVCAAGMPALGKLVANLQLGRWSTLSRPELQANLQAALESVRPQPVDLHDGESFAARMLSPLDA